MSLSKVPVKNAVEKWEEVAEQIAPFFAPPFLHSKEQIKNIKNALAVDKAHLWVYIKDGEPYFLVITAYVGEVEIFVRNLLILAFIKFKDITDEELEDSFQTVKMFAKKNGCFKLLAYTNDPRVLGIADKIGGSADQVVITWEI